MNYYNKNLNYLVNTCNKKKVDIARELDISRQNLQNLLVRTECNFDNLIKIAKYFNRTIDELLMVDLEKIDN